MQLSTRSSFHAPKCTQRRFQQRVLTLTSKQCQATTDEMGTSRVPSENAEPLQSRRNAMLAMAGIALSAQTLAMPTAAYAGPFGDDKKAQREEFTKLAEGVVSQMVTKEDSSAALRLAVRSASTYDAANKVGGFNGAIFTKSDELSHPENANLRPIVEKLKKVKAAVDEKAAASGFGPISYSDLMVLAVRQSTLDKWISIKTAAGNKDSIEAFGAPWPYVLGRVDGSEVGSDRLPKDDASVEDIRAALLRVGEEPNASKGPFSPKPLLWEKPGFLLWCAGAAEEDSEEARFVASDPLYQKIKKEYDGSRNTVTRTNYEVDFINFFTRLSYLGAKFDSNMYTKK